MNIFKLTIIGAAAFGLAACEEVGADKTTDLGVDSKGLVNLVPGIWVDPNGCDHWIIDDGVEGYMDARLDPDGKPVCSGVADPTFTAGDFKGGATKSIGDSL